MMEASPGRADLNHLLERDKTPRRVWKTSPKKNQRALDEEFGECVMDEVAADKDSRITEMEKKIGDMQSQIGELTQQRDRLKAEVQSLKKGSGGGDDSSGWGNHGKGDVDPWANWAGNTWKSGSATKAWDEAQWKHKESADSEKWNWRKDDRRKRTLTVGGYLRDSKRDEVVAATMEIFKDASGIEDNGIYSPFKRTSVVFVRFQTEGDKWTFLKGLKGHERPKYYGRSLWITSEKSSEERKRSRSISKSAKIFADKMGMPENSDRIETDYRAGAVWIDGRRVASWSRWAGKISFDGAQIEKLKIGWTSESAEEAWDLAMVPTYTE